MAEVAEALEPFLRQPVPPPAEAEMPSYCWAVRKAMASEPGTDSEDLVVAAAPKTRTVQIPAESRQAAKETRRMATVSSQHTPKEIPKVRHRLEVEKKPAENPRERKSWWLRAVSAVRSMLWHGVL